MVADIARNAELGLSVAIVRAEQISQTTENPEGRTVEYVMSLGLINTARNLTQRINLAATQRQRRVGNLGTCACCHRYYFDAENNSVPNFFTEMGGPAEWRYNRQGFIRKAVIAGGVVALLLYVNARRRRR